MGPKLINVPSAVVGFGDWAQRSDSGTNDVLGLNPSNSNDEYECYIRNRYWYKAHPDQAPTDYVCPCGEVNCDDACPTMIKNGDVRIVGPDALSRGRLDIYENGEWNWVCGHQFWNDDNGASVACRQLGYSSGTLLPSTAQKEQYSDTENLGDLLGHGIGVSCSGSESNLLECNVAYGPGSACEGDGPRVGIECV